uniref:G-protein coupled receptors family 1 profile domain-containing protein n=1 Tax=Onchocerca volvulus TaxID=6282 RepID=A0A8R1TV98_ONCVO
MTDHCSFLEESVKCSILSSFGKAPLKCLRYAFLAVTIERFIAMCCYQRYEKWNYPIALAFLPLTWIELALTINHIVLTFYRSQNTYKSYCSSITSNAIPYLKLILEIPLLIGLFFLLLITRIISKRKMILRLQAPMDTLSSRYQIRENMKTSKTMFIATIMYIISAFLNLSGLVVLTNLSPAHLLHFAIFKEITSLAIAIFINCLPILFIIRVDYLHDKIINWLLHFGCITTNKVGEEPMNRPLSNRQHIEIIQQIWEKEVQHK